MTGYHLLLLGHIVCAMAWIGVGIALQVLSMRALRGGQGQLVEFLNIVDFLGNRVQGPAALLVVTFGVLLVIDGEWGFGKLWVILAIAAVALSFVIAIGYLGPETKRMSTLIGQRGFSDEQVQSRLRRLMVVSRVELVLLVAVIVNMIFKPGM
jgi:hypothetical protein